MRRNRKPQSERCYNMVLGAQVAREMIETGEYEHVVSKCTWSFFRTQTLVATGNTGKLLHDELGLEVERVAHGPFGGDLIIGGRVANDEIEAVLFFRDPLTAQPHEPDVSALMRVCDVHTVPLATNRATAQAVVKWLMER